MFSWKNKKDVVRKNSYIVKKFTEDWSEGFSLRMRPARWAMNSLSLCTIREGGDCDELSRTESLLSLDDEEYKIDGDLVFSSVRRIQVGSSMSGDFEKAESLTSIDSDDLSIGGEVASSTLTMQVDDHPMFPVKKSESLLSIESAELNIDDVMSSAVKMDVSRNDSSMSGDFDKAESVMSIDSDELNMGDAVSSAVKLEVKVADKANILKESGDYDTKVAMKKIESLESISSEELSMADVVASNTANKEKRHGFFQLENNTSMLKESHDFDIKVEMKKTESLQSINSEDLNIADVVASCIVKIELEENASSYRVSGDFDTKHESKKTESLHSMNSTQLNMVDVTASSIAKMELEENDLDLKLKRTGSLLSIDSADLNVADIVSSAVKMEVDQCQPSSSKSSIDDQETCKQNINALRSSNAQTMIALSPRSAKPTINMKENIPISPKPNDNCDTWSVNSSVSSVNSYVSLSSDNSDCVSLDTSVWDSDTDSFWGDLDLQHHIRQSQIHSKKNKFEGPDYLDLLNNKFPDLQGNVLTTLGGYEMDMNNSNICKRLSCEVEKAVCEVITDHMLFGDDKNNDESPEISVGEEVACDQKSKNKKGAIGKLKKFVIRMGKAIRRVFQKNNKVGIM